MKRKHKTTRKREIWRPSLTTDIANHIHAAIIAYDGITDYWTLIAWHQTCQAYQKQWRDPEYLTPLLCRVRECARRRVIVNPLSAQCAANLSMLDRATLIVQLGEAVYQCCHCGPGFWTQSSVTINTRCVGGNSLRKAFAGINDARALVGEGVALERRIHYALLGAFAYVERKYGWVIGLCRTVTRGNGFARKTTEEDVNLASEIFLNDVICYRLAPKLYKK